MSPSFQDAWAPSPRNSALRTRRRATRRGRQTAAAPPLRSLLAQKNSRPGCEGRVVSRRFRLRKCDICRICGGAGGPGPAGNATFRNSCNAALPPWNPEASPQWAPRPDHPPRLFTGASNMAPIREDHLESCGICWRKVLRADMAGVYIGYPSEVNPPSPLPGSAGLSEQGDSSLTRCVMAPCPSRLPPRTFLLVMDGAITPAARSSMESAPTPRSKPLAAGQRLTLEFTSLEIGSRVDGFVVGIHTRSLRAYAILILSFQGRFGTPTRRPSLPVGGRPYHSFRRRPSLPVV